MREDVAIENSVAHRATATTRLGRFAVKGVFWRQYLDWAVVNLPFFFYPVNVFFFTTFFFFFAAPARRAIVANLLVVLPGSSRVMTYLRAFRILYNFAWTIAEAAIHRILREEFSYEIADAETLEELGAAQGAIVLTAHMGSYDLGAALFAEKFQRAIRIVRAPEPHAETAEHLHASLERSGESGVRVDYNTAGALLSFDLLKALRDREIVSIQGDRVEGEMGQAGAPLFGAEAKIPTGPFVLSLVAKAPIYPLFVVRIGCRRYEIIVRPPIRVQSTGNREADVSKGVADWCAILEEVIARHWNQWFALVAIFR